MENVIYNELRRLGYGVDVGLVETMKRNAEGKTVRSNLEIDFVVNRHDERIYIQSAYALPDKLTLVRDVSFLSSCFHVTG